MAFVRIGQFKALPGTADQLQRIYEMEAIRSAAGNMGAFLLQQHRSSENFMAITVWKTQDDADAYDKSGQALAMVNKIRF
jgi:heme-degrading monooxygenase HmoA